MRKRLSAELAAAMKAVTVTACAAVCIASAPPALAAASEPLPRVPGPQETVPEGSPDGRRPGPAPEPMSRSPEPASAIFGGLNSPGLTATGLTPPDATGAIGTSHYVEMVNAQIGVYARSNLGLIPGGSQSLLTFAGANANFIPSIVYDPQIVFDPQAERWFYFAVAERVTGSAPFQAGFVYGFSKTSDPSDLANGWCKYRSQTGGAGLIEDYPKLGQTSEALVIGTNAYDFDPDTGAHGSFVTGRIYRLPQPTIGSGGVCPNDPLGNAFIFGQRNFPLTTSDGGLAATPVPANMADGSRIGYVAASDLPPQAGSRSQIMLWRIGNPNVPGQAGALEVSPLGKVNVTDYARPTNAQQPGTAFLLDTMDGRLTQAVGHRDPSAGGAETVWVQHTINGDGNRSVARWYQLQPEQCANATCPASAKRQEGTISVPNSWVFNAAISPGRSGTQAAINYNVSGPGQLAQIRARTRNATTPLSEMTGEIVIAGSSTFNQDHTCSPPPCRWGDYAGASPDPLNPSVVWGSNQLIGSPSGVSAHWTTRNFALAADPSVPNACFTASPNPLPTASPIALSASCSSDRDGVAITGVAWDLDGDGGYSDASGFTTSRTFPTAGTYTVGVRVSAAHGLSAVLRQNVTVTNRAPSAAISVSPNPVETDALVSFSAAGSRDSDGSITSYKWDLDGNGSFETNTGSSPSASRRYSVDDTYVVKVIAEDNNGAQSEAHVSLFVVLPLTTSLDDRWRVVGRITRVRRLALRRVPAGARIRISCRGKSCPFKRRTLRIPRESASVSLQGRLKGRRLRTGTVLTIQLFTTRGEQRWTYRMRTQRLPKTTIRCIRPGGKPQRC